MVVLQVGEHSVGVSVRRRGPDLGRSDDRFRSVAAHRCRNRLHDVAVRSRSVEAVAAGGEQYGLDCDVWYHLDDGVVLVLHQDRWRRSCVLLYRLWGPAPDKHHFGGAVDVKE